MGGRQGEREAEGRRKCVLLLSIRNRMLAADW